jgi:GTPase involved in cell partitioning and DNA repair
VPVQKSGGEVVAVEDVNWKEDAKGLPGRQLGLQLLLRVVADVGIVGFPNAGRACTLGGRAVHHRLPAVSATSWIV